MVEYAEDKGAFRVVVDKVINGKRIRKTKLLPNGSTFEAAQRLEAMMLDEFLTFRERLQLCANESQKGVGHIYVIRNEYLPGLVKIGMTSGPVQGRIRNLSSALPSDYELVHCVYVNHAYALEQSLHAYFARHRVNKSREFFKMSEKEAIAALDMAYEVDGASFADTAAKIGMR